MRMPHVRVSMRCLLILIAVVGIVLGAERLWRGSEHFRKQAALCAFFGLQQKFYATSLTNEVEDEHWTIEEKRDIIQEMMNESDRYGKLKAIYHRIARQPWRLLPPDTPPSINPWDLGRLSASEIEEEVRDRQED